MESKNGNNNLNEIETHRTTFEDTFDNGWVSVNKDQENDDNIADQDHTITYLQYNIEQTEKMRSIETFEGIMLQTTESDIYIEQEVKDISEEKVTSWWESRQFGVAAAVGALSIITMMAIKSTKS